MTDVYTFCDAVDMGTMAERLRWARERKAGIASARQAAIRLKVPPSSYAAHENGQNEFDAETARRYRKAYGVAPGWLLTGEGKPDSVVEAPPTVPLVGYVSAGAEAHFFSDQGELDRVPAPAGTTAATVAVEIRGDSLGSFFDRWLVFLRRRVRRHSRRYVDVRLRQAVAIRAASAQVISVFARPEHCCRKAAQQRLIPTVNMLRVDN